MCGKKAPTGKGRAQGAGEGWTEPQIPNRAQEAGGGTKEGPRGLGICKDRLLGLAPASAPVARHLCHFKKVLTTLKGLAELTSDSEIHSTR